LQLNQILTRNICCTWQQLVRSTIPSRNISQTRKSKLSFQTSY